jgi:hypothetical protein
MVPLGNIQKGLFLVVHAVISIDSFHFKVVKKLLIGPEASSHRLELPLLRLSTHDHFRMALGLFHGRLPLLKKHHPFDLLEVLKNVLHVFVEVLKVVLQLKGLVLIFCDLVTARDIDHGARRLRQLLRVALCGAANNEAVRTTIILEEQRIVHNVSLVIEARGL